MGQAGNKRRAHAHGSPKTRSDYARTHTLHDVNVVVVNDRSIMSLKRRALRRTKTLRRDTEMQEVIPPSKISAWASKAKAPFTRDFWEDAMERTDDESLVDGKLLSYSYLEAGVIEMLGAYVLVSVFVGANC